MRGYVGGSSMVNCGRTASLGAPSGPVMQSMCAKALKNAEIHPLDIDCVEADAYSKLLDDAIEVNSCLKVYRNTDRDREVLSFCSGKSSHGHGMAGAALCAALKSILS